MKLQQSWEGERARLETEQLKHGMTLNRMQQKVGVIWVPIYLDYSFLSIKNTFGSTVFCIEPPKNEDNSMLEKEDS